MLQSDPLHTGVAVVIVHNQNILISKRPNMPQTGHWQCPGGFIQANEEIFASAQRHALRETGLIISELEHGPTTINTFDNAPHTTTHYVCAKKFIGQLQPVWQWCHINELPQPLFLPLQLLLQQNYFWLQNACNS